MDPRFHEPAYGERERIVQSHVHHPTRSTDDSVLPSEHLSHSHGYFLIDRNSTVNGDLPSQKTCPCTIVQVLKCGWPEHRFKRPDLPRQIATNCNPRASYDVDVLERAISQ